MKKKNDRYDFRINSDSKEKFKVYCKIMNVSPSDILGEVVEEFNDNAEKIINMRDIKELRNLFNEKMNIAEREIQKVEERPALEE